MSDSPPQPPFERDSWFWDHYDSAANEIIDFFAAVGGSLTGMRVADIGSGVGETDLGLAHRAQPASIVGFDIQEPDVERLASSARSQGLDGIIPANLSFRTCTPTTLPADDNEFDVVLTWSAFEHVTHLDSVCKEIARVLAPDGMLFMQVWPLYYSEHGSHLWEWYPQGHAHLTKDERTIRAEVMRAAADQSYAQLLLGEFAVLNRARLDDIHASLQRAGLAVRRLELIAPIVNIEPDVSMTYPLSDLSIAGFKLIARHFTG